MKKRYRVGIDVGLKSTGLSAIEIDDSDDNPYGAIPMRLLSIMSVIHDGGVDPDKAKSGDSRKSCSGMARRARKLRKRQVERLRELDNELEQCGFDCKRAESVIDLIAPNDPYYSWKIRALAAADYLDNDAEREAALVVSIRSIARHRGWRNPYSSVNVLQQLSEKPSSFYIEFVDRLVEKHLIDLQASDVTTTNRLTPAQLVVEAGLLRTEYSFRGVGSDSSIHIPLGKLHQSDYYHELIKIFRTQRVCAGIQTRILDCVFYQVNPVNVGAASKMIAKDALTGKIRASKASPTFQQYRILTTICNLSIRSRGTKVPLSTEQRKNIYDYLSSTEAAQTQTSWHDVAEKLSIDRNHLAGVGGLTEDGDPISAKMPPTMDTERLLLEAVKKHGELASIIDWWHTTSDDEREMFVELASNAGIDRESLDERDARALSNVDRMLSQLPEEVIQRLEEVELPSGRVAYSVDTMRRLNARMLNEGLNLQDARKKEFGVDSDWQPTANPLGTPTGNPAADRTIRIVSRWLKTCVDKWGVPETVNIEHVREGFTSPKLARRFESDANKRYKKNQQTRDTVSREIKEDIKSVSRSDIRRWQALQRQNCQCAYCGRPIDFYTSQMDHIVPRKGPGSTNDRENLVAVCAECNKSKSNIPFARWADKHQLEETIGRVRHWNIDSTFPNRKAFEEYKKDVIDRLQKTEADDPIDARSIESVAWMARELAAQIKGYLHECEATKVAGTKNDSPVHVYRGWITAEARRASGLEGRLPWIGDRSGKTRLDRRHHAIDASVIAMLRPAVVQVLAERDSMHRAFEDSNDIKSQGWKDYCGDGTFYNAYINWRDRQMQALCMLLTRAMNQDQIIVTSPLRLEHSRGKVHEDTIRKCVSQRLGDKMSAAAIDKVASPAIWTALTRLSDYDNKNGLAEDPNRSIQIHGKVLGPDSPIRFMCENLCDLSKEKDAIPTPVRNGFAGAGIAIHHARIYRIKKRHAYQYVMMRVAAIDLTKCHGDLFTYQLPMSSVSFRFADHKFKQAFLDGTAEYVGWLVVNDEIAINPTSDLFSTEGTQAIHKFMTAFPTTRRFKVTGFPQKTKIKLEALQLASEGLPNLDEYKEPLRTQLILRTYGSSDLTDADIKAIGKAFGNDSGLLLSVDKLFNSGVDVVRRSVLGYPRWNSHSGLPNSWSTRSD